MKRLATALLVAFAVTGCSDTITAPDHPPYGYIMRSQHGQQLPTPLDPDHDDVVIHAASIVLEADGTLAMTRILMGEDVVREDFSGTYSLTSRGFRLNFAGSDFSANGVRAGETTISLLGGIWEEGLMAFSMD